jgi:phage terminase large subunit GpA-like protein
MLGEGSVVNECIAKLRALVAPPRKLLVSQWADEYRQLSSESSAEPGQWKTSRVEYLREILDSLNDSSVEEIVMCTSSQIGKSEMLMNCIGYFMHQDPSPMLFVLPTLDMARTISKDRISPMIRDTPVLRPLVDERSRSAGNEILKKNFPGGHLSLCGSNSPASLSSRPCRVVNCDEVDRFDDSAGQEGDPVNLAKRRTQNFLNRKILLTSTPTIKGFSRIQSAYDSTDARKFYVPCPHCNTPHILEFINIRWEGRDVTTARYECPQCSEKISDAQINAAVRKGQWKATKPPSPGREKARGYWVWALYSPWVSVENIVSDWFAAQGNPEQIKVFKNTVLGEVYEDESTIEKDASKLLARCEPYTPYEVPEKASLVTAGVDVQDNRLAISIYAWGEGEESWLLFHNELYGDVLDGEVWKQLHEFLQTPLKKGEGEIKIKITCIDSSDNTQEVYNFLRNHKGFGYLAIKGSGQFDAKMVGAATLQDVSYKGKTVKGGVKLFPVGVSQIKRLIYSRLDVINQGSNYIHFYLGLDEDYFKQLTAEKLVVDPKTMKKKWIKLRKRNEAFDTAVYAYAAALLAGVAHLGKKSKAVVGMIHAGFDSE